MHSWAVNTQEDPLGILGAPLAPKVFPMAPQGDPHGSLRGHLDAKICALLRFGQSASGRWNGRVVQGEMETEGREEMRWKSRDN